MLDLRSIEPLLDVLNTSVKGPRLAKLVFDHALIGPDEDGYWENSRCGISIGSVEGVVTVIFLHGLGNGDSAQFVGPLPASLTFEAGLIEVRRIFGEPESSSGPCKMPGVFFYGGWDRFEVGTYRIHFTYRVDDGRIELVTLMPREPANSALNPTGLRPAD